MAFSSARRPSRICICGGSTPRATNCICLLAGSLWFAHFWHWTSSQGRRPGASAHPCLGSLHAGNCYSFHECCTCLSLNRWIEAVSLQHQRRTGIRLKLETQTLTSIVSTIGLESETCCVCNTAAGIDKCSTKTRSLLNEHFEHFDCTCTIFALPESPTLVLHFSISWGRRQTLLCH